MITAALAVLVVKLCVITLAGSGGAALWEAQARNSLGWFLMGLVGVGAAVVAQVAVLP